MAQLIQARNDSHIISPGHAPNAPLIQASAPPPERFRVTGDDPNARPDDRSVWNPQTNQWERGTVALANQNARLSDERRGQMALEADMRRSLNTPIDVGALGGVVGGRMPTQGEVDAMFGNVRRGAERARASMGLPSSVLPSANGKKGSVTFTGGGVPGEAAPVDPMARWIEANAFLRDADGNVKTGWEEQAKWLEGQMQAEWGRRYGFRNGQSVVNGIVGEPGAAAAPGAPAAPGTGAPAPAAQGATLNDDNLRAQYAQMLGVAPAGAPAAAPAAPGAAAPDAGAPARRGKFRIAKADGSYVIEGEGDNFTETRDGVTTRGRLGGTSNGQAAPVTPVAPDSTSVAKPNMDTPERRGAAKERRDQLLSIKKNYGDKAMPPHMEQELADLNDAISAYESTQGVISKPTSAQEMEELSSLLNPTQAKQTSANAKPPKVEARPLTEVEKREQEELDKMLMGE